jgi:quercetin dioxygenase-like cupin family protein
MKEDAMETSPVIVRAAAEGDRRWFLGGGVHIWKLTAAETGGQLFLFEDHLVQGKMTPLHLHPTITEVIYMLEGTLIAHVDGTEVELGPGGVAMFPAGVAHALHVTSPTARLLCFQSPGSGEPFYRDASQPDVAGTGPVDFARLGAVARSHDDSIQLLGPPPFRR